MDTAIRIPDATPVSATDVSTVQTVGQLRILVAKAGSIVVEVNKENIALQKRITELEAESWEVKAIEFINEIGMFLDSSIVGLPCESRVRTMDEYVWDTCMYYRDQAYELLDEKKKAFRK